MKPTVLFASLLLLASCGPGEKERIAQLQAQKVKEDSVRIAEIQRLKDAEAFRSALNDSLTAYNTLVTQQQNALAQLRTAIYAANDELSQIRESSPGRDQVQRQELKIQSLIVQQITLQSAMQHSQAEIKQIRSQLTPASR
jgi:hypothetical protein